MTNNKNTLKKKRALLVLAKKRQKTHWRGYHSIGEYRNGVYECNHVSPYTKSAGNVDSSVMVILQDWSSHNALKGPKNQDSIDFGYSRTLATNRRLAELLGEFFQLTLNQIYATNLFPFIKRGQLSERIPQEAYIRAAEEFCIPQIEIVNPKLVICLGLQTFNAIRTVRLSESNYVRNIDTALRSHIRIGDSEVWCQAHTGARGQNARGKKQVLADWRKMKRSLFP